MEISKKSFIILFTIIVFLAFFLRIYQLELKPMHHDEAILAYYYLIPQLSYQPLNFLGIEYHGLAFHYFTFPFIKIFGFSLFSMRLSAAFIGVLTVLLLYFLKDEIGKLGTLISALILSISPIFVYYSRQYTGYPFYLFFILLLIIFTVKFSKSEKPSFLYLIAITSAILLNINEAFIVFLFILGMFIYSTYLFNLEEYERFLQPFKRIPLKKYLYAFFILIFVFLMLHTSFFTNIKNINGLISADSEMTTKAINTGHNKGFFYYIKLMTPFEFPLLFLSALGLFYHKRSSFSRFIIVWSVFSLLIFSLISYKTNWTLPAIIFPLIFLAGIGADKIFEEKNLITISLAILLSLLIIVNIGLSYQQNFSFVNDFKKNKIGYVEASTDTLRLVKDILEYSKDNRTDVLISASSYWPLPMMLDNKNIAIQYITLTDLNTSNYQNFQVYIVNEEQLKSRSDEFDYKSYEMRENYYITVLFKIKDSQIQSFK